MDLALISLHNAAFQPLANITWANKEEYALRYNYGHACKVDSFYGVTIGFEKIWLIRDMMEAFPNCEWFWWTGCDSIITNHTIDIKDRIDNDYHFIIATDCNGINADSFLIRNSPQGRAYVKMIIDSYDKYKSHHWAEQQCIIDTYEEYRWMVKIVEQRALNSYDYGLYPECVPVDKNGNNGQWQHGDLLIHWPGTALGRRIQLAQYYSTQVVR